MLRVCFGLDWPSPVDCSLASRGNEDISVRRAYDRQGRTLYLLEPHDALALVGEFGGDSEESGRSGLLSVLRVPGSVLEEIPENLPS